MMRSNLPPGVTEDMIPGNRPEDGEWEEFHEWLEDLFIASKISPAEARVAVSQAHAQIQSNRAKLGAEAHRVRKAYCDLIANAEELEPGPEDSKIGVRILKLAVSDALFQYCLVVSREPER